METYLIVIGQTSTGYSAHCPDVLGCAAVGKTVEQVAANMKNSLEFHFEGMAEDGDLIPKARGVVSYRKLIKNLDVSEYFLGHVLIDTSRFSAPVCQSQPAAPPVAPAMATWRCLRLVLRKEWADIAACDESERSLINRK